MKSMMKISEFKIKISNNYL